MNPERYSRSPQGKKRRRRRPSAAKSSATGFYRAIAVEISLKLAVNAALSATALLALVKLIPHYQQHSHKIAAIRAEVTQTEERVERLRREFSRSFDPYQGHKIVQEQTGVIFPNERPIAWIEPDELGEVGN